MWLLATDGEAAADDGDAEEDEDDDDEPDIMLMKGITDIRDERRFEGNGDDSDESDDDSADDDDVSLAWLANGWGLFCPVPSSVC
jgi:hypothetical protein